jgi:hypothetical protein
MPACKRSRRRSRPPPRPRKSRRLPQQPGGWRRSGATPQQRRRPVCASRLNRRPKRWTETAVGDETYTSGRTRDPGAGRSYPGACLLREEDSSSRKCAPPIHRPWTTAPAGAAHRERWLGCPASGSTARRSPQRKSGFHQRMRRGVMETFLQGGGGGGLGVRRVRLGEKQTEQEKPQRDWQWRTHGASGWGVAALRRQPPFLGRPYSRSYSPATSKPSR